MKEHRQRKKKNLDTLPSFQTRFHILVGISWRENSEAAVTWLCGCGLTQAAEGEWFSVDGRVVGAKMADRPPLILRGLGDLLRLSFHQPSSLTGSVTLCGHTKRRHL